MGQTSTGTLRASPAQLVLSAFALVALMLSLFAFANPVRATHTPEVGDATIAIFKQMCASIGAQNVCNGRDTSLKDYNIDYEVFNEGADPDEDVPIHTITVTLGDNAGGGGNLGAGSQGRSTSAAFDSGTTYLVCEVEVAYKADEDDVPLDATPRPDRSTGGTNQNELLGDRCIEATLTGGAAELKFLDQRADAPPTVTDVNLAKRDDDGRALDVSFTLASNTTDFSITVATGSDGSLVFEDLFEDEYTLTETAPVGCTGIGELTVTVNGDGTVTVESDPRVSFNATTNTLTIVNDCGSPLNLVKRNQSGTALAGVSFTLTASGQTTGTTLLTNAQGTLSFLDLDPGSYTLTEAAPAGCTGIGSISLTIAANGNVTLSAANAAVAVTGNTLTITNNCPPPTGTLSLLKVDNSAAAATRGGAVFTLTRTGFSATATTIAAGTASFTGLAAGDYSLAETTAPTGCTGFTGSITIRVAANGSVSTVGTLPAGVTFTSATATLRVVNTCPVLEVTLGGNPTPTPTPVVREATQAAAVPNTAMDAPMNQLPVVFLALLTLGSLGYLGRRNLMGVRNRR